MRLRSAAQLFIEGSQRGSEFIGQPQVSCVVAGELVAKRQVELGGKVGFAQFDLVLIVVLQCSRDRLGRPLLTVFFSVTLITSWSSR